MHAPALHVELIKLRRAPIWVAFIALPLVSAAIGTFNYHSNLAILQDGWFDLWIQHTLFEGMFFLHALVGALCAWLMRLEHRGSNWNQLMASPVGIGHVLAAKFVVGWAMLGVALVVVGLLFLACGKLAGLPGLPGPEYGWWLTAAWIGGAASVACQLLASLVIRSFAAPVGIAVVGGLVGFLANAYGYGLACPWGLLVLGLNSNGHGSVGLGNITGFLVATAMYATFALGLAAHLAVAKDVRTT